MVHDVRIQLQNEATVDGDSDEVVIDRAGSYIYNALGDDTAPSWDGADVQLKVKPAGFDRYRDVEGAAFTVDGGIEVRIAEGDSVKDTLSSLGGTSIKSSLTYVDKG
ncbi:MAG: hypothetical protein MRY32_04230 [Rickettsiales bacterium]|nr:hypothetical protein [Rickettsiales bacterium]